mmetsp:Transcript_80433/g.211209  ORF Transcript_80433/g.211209 Transcript_80433/m.211209 type:complete len:542 (-) Transcript_80433:189-1814(-)
MAPPPDSPAATNTEEAAAKPDYYAGNAATIGSSGSYYDRMEKHVVREKLTPDARGILICMVGLPARGKSFISRRVERFFQWRGMPTRSFNVGKYRRDDTESSARAGFFDHGNKAAKEAREKAAMLAMEDAMGFLDGGGKVAILDATNSTQERRRRIADCVRSHKGGSYNTLFLEAVCNDVELLDANMREKVRNSPDFKGLSIEDALKDLRDRIKKYEDVYETVEDDEGAYIKLYNLSSKILANHCFGRIAKTVLPYLMAIHIGARPIWLVRAGGGQKNPNCHASCDRNALLSAAGRRFALSLAAFVRERSAKYWQATEKPPEPCHVVSSTMSRAIASACYTSIQHEQTSALNPIDKGTIGSGWWDVECHGEAPPWDEVESRHPAFAERFRKDPLRTRFPGGECYMDVIRRLEGLLVEVEMCTRPVLIVSHITAIQPLIAYFSGLPVEQCWGIEVPKDTVFEVTPSLGGGFLCTSHALKPMEPHEADLMPQLTAESGIDVMDAGFSAGDSPTDAARAARGEGEEASPGFDEPEGPSKRQRVS